MPWNNAVRTTALTAAFIPPASPPLVSTAMLDGADGVVFIRVASSIGWAAHPPTASAGREAPRLLGSISTAGGSARRTRQVSASMAARSMGRPLR